MSVCDLRYRRYVPSRFDHQPKYTSRVSRFIDVSRVRLLSRESRYRPRSCLTAGWYYSREHMCTRETGVPRRILRTGGRGTEGSPWEKEAEVEREHVERRFSDREYLVRTIRTAAICIYICPRINSICPAHAIFFSLLFSSQAAGRSSSTANTLTGMSDENDGTECANELLIETEGAGSSHRRAKSESILRARTNTRVRIFSEHRPMTTICLTPRARFRDFYPVSHIEC